VKDSQGHIVAHDKHVLSMKNNNQNDSLREIIDTGVRNFKIEGEGRTHAADQRERETDPALRLQAVRDARVGEDQAQRDERGAS
jgi:collagenase-like PrtC family protease